MYPFDTPFYHTLTALSAIETRQAAFTIVPYSHTRAREWLAGLSAGELERMRDDGEFRGSQSQAFLASGAVDRAEAVEVLMGEGDTCIFELLCTHSASRNERVSCHDTAGNHLGCILLKMAAISLLTGVAAARDLPDVL